MTAGEKPDAVPESGDPDPARERDESLSRLLGLAQRAGRLAVGFSAVERLVQRGERPLLVLAVDVGPGQLGRIERWTPVNGLVRTGLGVEELGALLGRDKVAVLGVTDPGFVKGIGKLGY